MDIDLSGRLAYLSVIEITSQVTFFILLLAGLLLLSAIFSATEMAFSSLNVIRVKQQTKSRKNTKKAKKVYYWINNYTRLLNSVLIANNVVNMAASALVTFIFSVTLNLGETGVLIATIVVSFFVIIFGEIVPKNFAKAYPEKFAYFIVYPITFLAALLKPITFILGKINTKIVSNENKEDKVTATENELLEIVDTIEREGVLEQTESEIIRGAITFDDISVRTAMTPKEKVTIGNENMTTEEIIRIFANSKYSRLPIANKDGTKIIGVIYQTDLFEVLAKNAVNYTSLNQLIRKTIYVSHRRLLPYALEKMQKQKAHLAVVVDNLKEKNFYGVLTLEDILEEIVGEIYDEYDELPKDIIEIGHHIFEVAPSYDLDDLFENYLDEADEPKTKCKTLGQWVKELMNGKIVYDEDIHYDNLIIRVIKGELNTIKKIEIHQITKQEEDY